MTIIIILLAVVCLAYANGANDNFKGVATLLGSGTTSFRGALVWATVTTLTGSLAAVFLADQLLKRFSGKGLVGPELAADPYYGAAVALGAGLTVLLATLIGMPISTTHGLIGALIGAGMAAGSSIQFGNLGAGFVFPLLISPLLAIGFTGLCYPALRSMRRKLGISETTCFCVGTETVEVVPLLNQTAALHRVEQLSMTADDTVTCQRRYQGNVLGIEASAILDRAHYLSSGMVSFARGLNDTPKIAAMLLLAPAISGVGGLVLVGVMIALGGLISACRVARTMSQDITTMNHGQGFTANMMTAAIVIGASRFGLPVSTTHVSCGALFGIGATTGQAHKKTIVTILAAWVTTLPVAALLGAVCFWGLRLL